MAADASSMRFDPVPPTAIPSPAVAGPTAPIRLILDLGEEGAAALRRTGLLKTQTSKRPVTRHLDQTYWDTPDHALGRAGLALGIQKAGTKHLQLMDRIAERRTGGMLAADSSAPVAGDRPDLVRLALAPGADPARISAIEPASLIPVFALGLKRTRWTLSWLGTTISLTLDEGQITASVGQTGFRQLILGVTGGPAAGLYDFAKALSAEVPFRLADLDAVQQGYRFIGETGWWPLDPTPDLLASMTTRAGILAIGRAALAELRVEIEAVTTMPAPDHIHQARVAIRRLRSVLSVFGRVLPTAPRLSFARALGDLASRLGEAREWDVFVAETLDPIAEALAGEASLKTLRLSAAVLRERAADSLKAGLDAPSFMALSLDLGCWFDAGIWPEPPAAEGAVQPEKAYWLDRPLRDFAKDVLRRRHRKLLNTGAALADPRPAELHQLRIEAKKLRYTAEFFARLFPAKASKPYLAALRQVQNVLGTLNDAAMVPGLVSRLVPQRDGAGYAAGVIAGWSAAEASTARKHFSDAWHELKKAKPFWKG